MHAQSLLSPKGSVGQRGFLLIEVLVSITVIVIFMTIALNERDDFARSVAIDNVAHEVALTIRQAQSYGISSQGSDIGDDVYDFAYGVHFDVGSSPNSFRLDRYSTSDSGSNINQQELINEYQLPSRMEFIDFCTFDTDLDSADCSSDDEGIILFRRPNPDARFFDDDEDGLDVDNVAIVLENDDGVVRTVVVNTTGYIYVE